MFGAADTRLGVPQIDEYLILYLFQEGGEDLIWKNIELQHPNFDLARITARSSSKTLAVKAIMMVSRFEFRVWHLALMRLVAS